MSAAPHRCRVIASPDAGVYATEVDSARHYARHWHTTYGFGLIARGAHRSASPQGAVDAFEGDIVCMNPGDVHDGRPLGGPSRRWFTVYIEPGVFGGIAGRSDVAFTKAAFGDARVRRAVGALLHAMEHGESLAFEEALVAACGLMLRGHSTLVVRDEEADGDLERVRERLADGTEAPSLDELAALSGLGKFQLLRRFRRRFGVTPHDWLVQRRAERARALIREGVALGDAAAACGFADQSHMTRVFVQRFGFTPGAWRAGAISFKTRA
ncbi:helix-turn-helix transcriptional regulator [Ramlibacter sp. PS4R-6]|uniref:helix-turn-helix transcriptional regulator n=1 Tax=Ramlibacter sp. PS4R-6 TaxID=3133438 RepID=UPI0030956D0B